MNRIFPIALLVIFVLVWSCAKDPEIDQTPPTGVWEELLWVPILSDDERTIHRYERMTYDEMCAQGKRFEDTLIYVCRRVEFNGAEMKVTVRIGDGPSDSCPHNDNSELPHQRMDYYMSDGCSFIKDGVVDSDDNSKKYGAIHAWCTFTDETFVRGSEPGECSSKGTFVEHVDFFYEDEDKKMLRIGYAAGTRTDIPLFRKIE